MREKEKGAEEEKINQYHIKTFYHRSLFIFVVRFFVFLPSSDRCNENEEGEEKHENESESMENALLPL
jgi:hypothetical protein